MSRGLGKLQRLILELLGERGPMWLIDIIAASWYFNHVEAPGEPGEPGEHTPAWAASVRRAVQSLERRKLVRCGTGQIITAWDDCRYCRKIVWLPDQPAPELKEMRRLGAEWIGLLVLEILTTVDALDAEGRWCAGYGGMSWVDNDPGMVPYLWLCKRVLEIIGDPFCRGEPNNREYMAINRAVWHLINEGKVVAYKPPEGVKRPSIGWVKVIA